MNATGFGGPCSVDAVLAAIGLGASDLFADDPKPKARPASEKLGPIVGTYGYHSWTGELLYETTRHDPKDFRQRMKDGSGGWAWSIKGIERVLYGLPELIDQADVYLAEGEEDVAALRAIGLAATTSCGGAKAWDRGRYAAQLVKAGCLRLVVLPDHNDAGRQYAEDAARSCTAAGIAVKMVELPGLPVGEDPR